MKQLIILSAFIISIPVALFSQVTDNEELKQLIKKSFSFFPKIAEAENLIKSAEEKKLLTELNRKPDLSANASYNLLLPKIAFPINGKEIQFVPVHNVGTSINASWTLFDFGRLKAAIDKEKTSIQLSKDQVEVTKSQLKAQVAGIYYSIVYLRKCLAIEDSIIKFYRDNQTMAERKVKNGDALQTDVLNFKSSVDAEENKKLDVEMALNKQLNLLAYTTGVSDIQGNEFDFRRRAILQEISDDVYINRTVRIVRDEIKNPEFTLAKDKIISAKSDLNVIGLNNKPSLNIHGASGIKNGYVPEVNDLRFNAMAGISFLLPIDAFGKTKQQNKYQQTIIKQQELSLQSLQLQFDKDIKQSQSNWGYLRRKAKNSANEIKAAQESQQLTLSRYQNGVATFVDLSAAEANIEKAKFSILQDEYQMCLENIELARLMGFEY